MRDFIYDFRRTVTGRFTIIMIVLIVLATAAIAYSAASNASTSVSSPGSNAYLMPEIYPVSGGFKVVDLAVNGYGQPVPGLKITSEAMNASQKGIGVPGSGSEYLNKTTNPQGFANFTISKSWSGVIYSYTNQYTDGISVSNSTAFLTGNTSSSSFQPNFYPPGLESIGSSNLSGQAYLYMFSVASTVSSSHSDVFAYYAAPNGSLMPSEKVYYKVDYTSFSFPLQNHTGMVYFKTIGGIKSTVFSVPLNSTADNAYVTVALFNASSDTFSAGTAGVLYKVVSAGSTLESVLSLPYEFLIPILGIFSAYFYYGKDKASGVLESIISRPVTKGRIFMSRFTAGSLSFLFAIGVAEGIADLIIFRYTGSWISSHTFFSIALGYTAEAIAFSGLIYLTSQYLKAQGSILGTGIGLFFILALFWGLIIDVILFESHVNLALKSSIVLRVTLSAISPSFIPTLASDLNTGVYSTGIGNSLPASSVGITAFSVVGVGIVWIIVPFVISFLLARSRD